MSKALRVTAAQANALFARLRGDVPAAGAIGVGKAAVPAVRSEHDEQSDAVAWARAIESRFPMLRWLHAIPNGGKRARKVAAMLKREGVLKGIPDLFLPYPVPPCHGLYIEMKRADGSVRKLQRECISYLNSVGYRAEVCRSTREAVLLICEYIGIDPAEHATQFVSRP